MAHPRIAQSVEAQTLQAQTSEPSLVPVPLPERGAEPALPSLETAEPVGDVTSVIMQAVDPVAGLGMVDPFVYRLAVFVLACFVGYYVVWSVTPALHTPLMAVTNAISSVIVVGALLAVGAVALSGWAGLWGFLALILASVNIFGGFLVTQRMLAMYKKKERP